MWTDPHLGFTKSFANFSSKFAVPDVAKCRNSREICPSACEFCLASAVFMPHIHSPFARFPCLVRYRSVAKFRTPARPPKPDHPPPGLPFRLGCVLPSHDACFISPNPKHALRRAQSVWRRVCLECGDCALLLPFFAELAGSVSAYVVLREQAANFAKFAG